MKNYRSFIIEAKKGGLKTVVMAFGRFNPPTTGHKKLVDRVHELADTHNAHHEVIVSHSQDAKKNPLTQEQKIKHARRYFSGTNIVGSSKEHPHFIAHAKRLSQAGHEHLIMVAGQDRVKEFHDTLHKYNGPGKEFNFKKISVVSAGARDPDAEGVEGMSASKMREHAKNNNFDEFRKGVPTHVSDNHAKELFHDTRKGMGLHEELSESCWSGYKSIGMKKKGNRMVPNCVPEEANLDKPTMSPEEIAKKHKVDVKEINRQLEMGIKVEKEHTKDEKTAREIALDHLGEKPNYYSKLKQYVESVVKVGTLIENDLGEVGKVLSLRENSVVYNVLATGMMKSSGYGDFSLVEAVGHLATGAPDYFFGGVADAPKDKQEEVEQTPQDKDIKHKKYTTPKKYYADLNKETKQKRYAHFRKNSQKSWKDPTAYQPAPGDENAKTKLSKHTKKYKRMYEEEKINNSKTQDDTKMNEEATKGLAEKSKKSGIPVSTLKKVYNRGVAAWRGGHRPGTTPQQWGMARVNSYITKGKGTYYGADSDLSGQNKKKLKKENVSTDYVDSGMNVPYYGSYGKAAVHNESIDEAFEKYMNETVHSMDTNVESHLWGTNSAKIAAQQMTPGEPNYVGMGKETSNYISSREGEEDRSSSKQEKTKKKNEKSKKEEDYVGGDYDARLSGASRAAGGIGGSYSIGVQESLLPNVDSIRLWALKETTQKNFIERYGNLASEKLIEAAHRMINAKTSFMSFRQKLDEADYAPQAFSMGSGSGPVLSPPETGYAKQAFGEASWTAAASMHAATSKRDPQRQDPKHNFRVGDHVITKEGNKSAKVVFVDGEKIHVKGTNPYYPDRVTHHMASELKKGVLEGYTDGESKKKPKMDKVNEDEYTFHCEEDELIEALQWDEESLPIDEAEYQGKKVQLGKPMPGDVKKSKVYVKGPSGRVVKVNFGDKNMTIKKNIPARRKSFRARHHCDTNPGPRWKARYWSCRAW